MEITQERIEQIIDRTVTTTMSRFGLDTSDPIELQKDFAHLRAWRESAEELKRKGLIYLLGIFITGTCGLLWVAFKQVH